MRHMCRDERRAVLLLLLCLVWFTLPGCTTEKAPSSGQVTFHFIDVGQGDASLITTPAGNILIDAGTNEAELSLGSYLELCGITEIDYLLLTHPHEDHIGGADMILSRFPVDTVIMTGAQADSVVAQRLYEGIEKAGCRVLTATPGLTLTLGDVRITVLGPGEEAMSETGTAVADGGEDGNDSSMIIRVDFGQVSALYMGDAEAEAEAWLLDTWQDSGLLDCDILKLGHHGSASSSTEAFLRAVTPAFGIVSAREGNPYGHPAASVLCRLEEMDITCLRTDTGNSVRLTTDGKTLWQE